MTLVLKEGWFYNGVISEPTGSPLMSVNLSIKNVPDALAAKIKARAVRNHRSLQGELLAILEATVDSEEILTPQEVLSRIRVSGLDTASESARFVRGDRDARSRR